MPVFLGEAAAPARPVAGVMADAPIGVCAPFPSHGHHGSGSRPGIVLPGFCSLGLPGLGGARRSGIRGLGSVRKVLCSRVGRVLVRRVLVGRVHALGVRGEGAHQRSACKEGRLSGRVEGFREVSISSIRPRRRRWGVAHIGGGGAPPTKGAVRGRPRRWRIFFRAEFGKHVGVLRWVGGVCRARFGDSSATPRPTPRLLFLPVKNNDIGAPGKGNVTSHSRRPRCAAFHRCLSAAFPRDAARLWGVVRVLRVGFGLFRSRKPARACLCAASAVPGCRVSA
jgi:hypothetical protein